MNNTIYLITNKINNKTYIGQTWNSIEYRWRQHYCPAEKFCRKLNRAINKYGKDNFVVEKLAQTSSQEIANYLEISYIKEYDSIKNGYNIKEGGSRGKHSEETKKLMSIAQKGRIVSKETRDKSSKSHLGKKLSTEQKDKISSSLKKYHKSNTSNKVSIALKKYYSDQDNRKKQSEKSKKILAGII